MSFPSTQTFLARHQFRTAGRVWSINTHWDCTSGYDTLTSSTALEDALQPLTDAIKAALSDSTTIEGTYISHVQSEAALPAKKSFPSTPGDIAGTNSLPPNTAAVFTLQSTDPDTRRTGRIYLAGIPDSEVSAGRLLGSYVTAKLDPIAFQLKSTQSASGQDFIPVILQRQRDLAVIDPPVILPIDSVRTGDILYTQRRRNSRQLGAGP